MKQFFRQYFAFSTSERNGIIILIIVLLLLIISPAIIGFFHIEETIDYAQIEEDLKYFGSGLNIL